MKNEAMQPGRFWTIPNSLTMLRIGLTVALYPILFRRLQTCFVMGYCAAFATDVLDGYLARRLKLESYLGMRLDSFADYFLIASSLIWAYLLMPELFREQWPRWVAMAVVLTVPQVIGFVKFRKNVGFHLYTTKAAGWIAFGLFAHALITGHYSGVLLRILLAAVVLKSLEETLICLTVRDPYADLRPSFLAYLIKNRRTPARLSY